MRDAKRAKKAAKKEARHDEKIARKRARWEKKHGKPHDKKTPAPTPGPEQFIIEGIPSDSTWPLFGPSGAPSNKSAFNRTFAVSECE